MVNPILITTGNRNSISEGDTTNEEKFDIDGRDAANASSSVEFNAVEYSTIHSAALKHAPDPEESCQSHVLIEGCTAVYTDSD